MKERLRYFFILMMLGVLSLFLILGCDEDETPVEDDTPDPVPANIFPLTTGHVIVYNEGTLLNLDTDVPIAGTEVGYQSKWIIAGQVAPGPAPYTMPTVILDTTTVLGNTVGRPFLAHLETTPNDYYFLTNLGYFFRSQQILDSNSAVRSDSLRWILLANPSSGVGVEWVAFNETFTSAVAGQLRLEIKAEFEGTETINAGGTNYTTYRLVATRRVYLGSSTTSISTAVTAKLWMAENIGPIQIELRGDAESNGKRQKMTAKNF
jgi:hypothetical protein